MLMFFFHWLSCFLLFLFPPAEQNTFRKKNLFSRLLYVCGNIVFSLLKILNNCHLDNSIIYLDFIEQYFLITLLIDVSGTNHFLCFPRLPLGEFTVKVRRLILSASWFHYGIPVLIEHTSMACSDFLKA